MSSIDLDGNHTTALCGGDCQSYQGRKKQKTTNAIYVTDRHGNTTRHFLSSCRFSQ